MGTNGAFSDAQFDQMMAVDREPPGVLRERARAAHVGDRSERAPRGRRAEVPERAPASTGTTFGGPHSDWFVSDGIHLTGAGAMGYADLIREHLEAGY